MTFQILTDKAMWIWLATEIQRESSRHGVEDRAVAHFQVEKVDGGFHGLKESSERMMTAREETTCLSSPKVRSGPSENLTD